MRIRRTAAVAGASVAMLAAGSGAAFAHECTNISKPVSAGVQVVIDASSDDGGIEWASQGVWQRVAQGIIDPDTGAGFHGLVGLDFDGDGTPDAATYIVGPNDELPEQAQWNGATCHGIVNIMAVLTDCQTTPL